jgi:cysteinyl-tRNA synthetase
MNDDFNSPILISELFEAARFINGLENGALSKEELALVKEVMHDFFFDVLGLEDILALSSGDKLEEVIQILIDLRNKARADRDFALSDAIRDQLAAAGINLKDGKDGTRFSLN